MYTFNTPGPIDVLVQNRAGRIEINATDTATSTVELTTMNGGSDAQGVIDDATVELNDRKLVVKLQQERRGLLRWKPMHIAVAITVPTGSSVTCEADSADITTSGELRSARLSTGSGDVTVDVVTGPLVTKSGSGDVTIASSHESLESSTGSGDVRIGSAVQRAVLKSGSGDVSLAHGTGTIEAKTGSGDIELSEVRGDITAKTGSGDVRIDAITSGRTQAATGTGDIRVGVVNGTAAWLDLNTVTGDVRNDLEDAGAPADGDETVELHIKTATGDIAITRA